MTDIFGVGMNKNFIKALFLGVSISCFCGVSLNADACDVGFKNECKKSTKTHETSFKVGALKFRKKGFSFSREEKNVPSKLALLVIPSSSCEEDCESPSPTWSLKTKRGALVRSLSGCKTPSYLDTNWPPDSL